MNNQIQTIIDRARALLANATRGPDEWRVDHNEDGAYVSEASNSDPRYRTTVCQLGHAEWDERNAALIAAAPGMLTSLCDALESAERRAEEAEAQAAVWREHTSALVTAMKTWGSWEDGVPDASDAGECGDVGRAFNAARDALAPDMNLKAWRCSACGETAASMTSAWRWTGSIWQHTHADAPQAGHFDAVYVDPVRALLVSLRAAEAERDALRAENERLNRAIGAATSIGRKVLVALESDDEMLCEDRADAFQSACEQMVSMLSGSGAVIVEGAAQEGGAE